MLDEKNDKVFLKAGLNCAEHTRSARLENSLGYNRCGKRGRQVQSGRPGVKFLGNLKTGAHAGLAA